MSDSYRQSKTALLRHGKDLTPGVLVSKLSFGFWVRLCNKPYAQGYGAGPQLWPAIVQKGGFPNLTDRARRNRSDIYHRFDEIRNLRNRISHYEPVWDRNLPKTERRVLSALAWMNKGLAGVLEATSIVKSVYDRGHTAFRETAESLVVIPEEKTD